MPFRKIIQPNNDLVFIVFFFSLVNLVRGFSKVITQNQHQSKINIRSKSTMYEYKCQAVDSLTSSVFYTGLKLHVPEQKKCDKYLAK